jgi:hypothetical protein
MLLLVARAGSGDRLRAAADDERLRAKLGWTKQPAPRSGAGPPSSTSPSRRTAAASARTNRWATRSRPASSESPGRRFVQPRVHRRPPGHHLRAPREAAPPRGERPVVNAGTEGYSTDQEALWLASEESATRPTSRFSRCTRTTSTGTRRTTTSAIRSPSSRRRTRVPPPSRSARTWPIRARALARPPDGARKPPREAGRAAPGADARREGSSRRVGAAPPRRCRRFLARPAAALRLFRGRGGEHGCDPARPRHPRQGPDRSRCTDRDGRGDERSRLRSLAPLSPHGGRGEGERLDGRRSSAALVGASRGGTIPLYFQKDWHTMP